MAFHRTQRHRFGAAYLMLACTAACSPMEDAADRQPPADVAAGASRTAQTFSCDGMHFDAVFEGEEMVVVSWPADSARLSRTPAATGSRWSDGVNSLWIGGGRTVLEVHDTAYECQPTGEMHP